MNIKTNKLNIMEYKNLYITGFNNLKNLINSLNNYTNIIDYTYECESRGENDDTHEYFVQIIFSK
jgi:hypothetical protein